MNIQEAKQEIKHTIKAYTAKTESGESRIPTSRQRPLLLIGPPGIGKTAIMQQVATECGIGFVSYTMTHHTRQSAIGLPQMKKEQFEDMEYTITEYTMSEIIASVYRLMRETGHRQGLLFLDEINCVSETLAPVMLQFLQNKMFGTWQLPEGWILATAGNTSEYNKSAREFDIATLDRLKYITIEPDYQSWRSYALTQNIHGAILSYLDIHPENFYVMKPGYSVSHFATARGWEDLSYILKEYDLENIPVGENLILQYLHEPVLAKEFDAYFRLYKTSGKQLPLADLCNGEPDAEAACLKLHKQISFEEKVQLTHHLLSYLGATLEDWKKQENKLSHLLMLQEQYERSRKGYEGEFLQKTQFIKEQKEIIRIRKEYHLSSEKELSEMEAALRVFQNASPETLASEQRRQDAYTKKVQDIIHNILNYYKKADTPEEILFLGGIRQNLTAVSFFQKYPSELLDEHMQKLDFETREHQLLNYHDAETLQYVPESK